MLLIPLVQRLPTVPDTLRPSLVAYLAVIIVSGMLAIRYLLIASETRIRPRDRTSPAA